MIRKTLAARWDELLATIPEYAKQNARQVETAKLFFYSGAAAFRSLAILANEMEYADSRKYRKAIDDELTSFLHRELYKLDEEEGKANG